METDMLRQEMAKLQKEITELKTENIEVDALNVTP